MWDFFLKISLEELVKYRVIGEQLCVRVQHHLRRKWRPDMKLKKLELKETSSYSANIAAITVDDCADLMLLEPAMRETAQQNNARQKKTKHLQQLISNSFKTIILYNTTTPCCTSKWHTGNHRLSPHFKVCRQCLHDSICLLHLFKKIRIFSFDWLIDSLTDWLSPLELWAPDLGSWNVMKIL